MKALITLKSVLTCGLVLGALAFASTDSAQAGGYGGYGQSGYGYGGYNYQPQYYWKTITTYESVRKEYIDYVTKYDHCGHPYQVQVVRYEYIQVPVTSRVKVYY